MAQGYSLKDQLFNPEKVAYLGGLFTGVWSGFDRSTFEKTVIADMPALELKQRISLIAEVLSDVLPNDRDAALAIVTEALPAPCDPSLSDDDFGDFIFAPLGEVVERRALDAPDMALPVLEEITQRFSMEYSIRPFLNAHEDQVMERMHDWVRHDHYHVRRLVSEGTRPKLPWGIKITLDPLRALPLLKDLHSDRTRFVTRSVANHMNDLSKIQAEVMMDQVEAWADGPAAPKERDWMTAHALRTLVKDGNTRALNLLGYRNDIDVTGQITLSHSDIAIGQDLMLNATLTADQNLPVLVDYVLHFHRPSGKPASKVFKWKQDKITAGKPLRLTKKRNLKGNASTFTLHPGPHRIGLQVNGKVVAEVPFTLTD